jgi:NAD(P)-dependent dehydrogenase (short-subunit alcohol dehydrogenase family)
VADRVDTAYLSELYGLAGRVALVTGARQGIGRELALAFARAGAAVAVTSRRPDELEGTAGELAALAAEHCELGLDVRSETGVADTVTAVTRQFGRLDVVVNNAGLSVRKPALEHSLEEWDAVIETNLRGTFLVSRESAKAMTNGGRIINLSSTFARAAHLDRAAYAASKAGVEQLTRVLALEWAERGITVNAIAPTTIETESRRDIFASEAARQERIRAIPLGRLGMSEDLVGVALMLAGPAGAFVTGQTILVDGGFTLGSAGR